MPSSSRRVLGAVAVVLALSAPAAAQPQARGFAVERFYPAAPGGGWLVMDDLELHGGLGGVVGVTLSYASNPLRVSDGVNRVAVVSDQAFADIGAAITYRRWRFYLDLDTPLVVYGDRGTVGAYAFSGPALDPASNPDVLSDARVGTDVRIFGRPGGAFRFGAGAQLLIPFGQRSDYVTDDTFRGMIRALFAGDVRWFVYAAQLGVHIRPLDDASVPGSPKGSELLFGAAAGARLPIGHTWVAVVGPEVYGATAFRAFFEGGGTAVEGLVSGRLETTRVHRANVRIKLGVGAGLDHRFGAAEWRLVAGVELFGRH